MKSSGYWTGGFDILVRGNEKVHYNNVWTLVYAKEGAGMYILDGRLTCLNCNDIIFIPPKVSCSFAPADMGDEYNENVEIIALCFNQVWLDALLKTFIHYGDLVLRLKEMKSAVMMTGRKWMSVYNLMNTLAQSSDEAKPLVILQILAQISTNEDTLPIQSSKSPEVTDLIEKKTRIDRYISCNLLSGVALEDIAAYAGMNRTYFCLFFKKHYGMGLIEYLNSIKLDMACTMLLKTDASIADIAIQCGFRTVTYFNRVFKAAKGISPKEYRTKTI